MISTTFGDMARQQGLSKNLRLAKSDISHLKQELATGQVRDKARLVQGNMIRLASLDRMIADTDARLGALSVLTVRLDTQQVAMIAVQDQVQLVADLLLRPELFSTDDRLSPVAAQVGQAFGAVIGFLNTQAGGRSLFAGQTTDQPALSDPSRMLADLALLIPSGAQKHVIDQIVDDWFAPSGGFEASGYLGGASDTTAHDLGGGLCSAA